MTRDRRDAGVPLLAVVAVLVAVGAVASAVGPTTPGGVVDAPQPGADPTPPATGGAASTSDAANEAAITALRQRALRPPIDDTDVERLKGMFGQSRGGSAAHEAVDIVAPRDTPIHAVDDGTIAKLFTSQAGGLTIYQYDPDQRFCYYYAHLERYAPGLVDGQRLTRGEVIGYVGTSGNAPPDTPHLHFAILEVGADQRWWGGRPIDPYLVLRTH